MQNGQGVMKIVPLVTKVFIHFFVPTYNLVKFDSFGILSVQ